MGTVGWAIEISKCIQQLYMYVHGRESEHSLKEPVRKGRSPRP
jgi:hypothetical protein